MYCKDCKWWEAYGLRNTATWAACGFPDWTSPGKDIAEDTMSFYATAQDDQGLDAGLKTGRMFGCLKFTQHVKRTQEDQT